MDEYIRLDTTIIGIDNLISKASTAEEANALFKAKDVIYSQQRCLTDVQPVKHGRWIEQEHIFGSTLLRYYECSECHVKVLGGERMEFLYCPMCSCRMDGGSDDTKREVK